jgi:hypothetical protein
MLAVLFGLLMAAFADGPDASQRNAYKPKTRDLAHSRWGLIPRVR